jgi:hypothetical protein
MAAGGDGGRGCGQGTVEVSRRGVDKQRKRVQGSDNHCEARAFQVQSSKKLSLVVLAASWRRSDSMLHLEARECHDHDRVGSSQTVNNKT